MNEVIAQQIIGSASTSLDLIKGVNKVFLNSIQSTALTIKNPVKLKVEEEKLYTEIFDILKATASPRCVGGMNNQNSFKFFIEYIFFSTLEEDKEIGRFYLTEQGQIIEDLESLSPICDYNDVNLAAIITRHILISSLSSSSLKPTKPLVK